MAEDFLCADGTTLVYFQPSVDPTQTRPCPAPRVRSEVPEEHIAAQRALWESQTIPRRHLKVVDGLMVEMTQGEKNAVDAPLIAEQTRRQDLQNEKASNTLCNATELSQLESRLDTFAANLASDNEAQSRVRIVGALRQIVKCLLARTEP